MKIIGDQLELTKIIISGMGNVLIFNIDIIWYHAHFEWVWLSSHSIDDWMLTGCFSPCQIYICRSPARWIYYHNYPHQLLQTSQQMVHFWMSVQSLVFFPFTKWQGVNLICCSQHYNYILLDGNIKIRGFFFSSLTLAFYVYLSHKLNYTCMIPSK